MSKLKEIFELRFNDDKVISIEGVVALRKAAKQHNFDANLVIGNFHNFIPMWDNNILIGHAIAARTARGIWIN
tara:strand:+ start:224 stop:442 length:219 start_codon:yes stop_codon:yes gene_type:complete